MRSVSRDGTGAPLPHTSLPHPKSCFASVLTWSCVSLCKRGSLPAADVPDSAGVTCFSADICWLLIATWNFTRTGRRSVFARRFTCVFFTEGGAPAHRCCASVFTSVAAKRWAEGESRICRKDTAVNAAACVIGSRDLMPYCARLNWWLTTFEMFSFHILNIPYGIPVMDSISKKKTSLFLLPRGWTQCLCALGDVSGSAPAACLLQGLRPPDL